MKESTIRIAIQTGKEKRIKATLARLCSAHARAAFTLADLERETPQPPTTTLDGTPDPLDLAWAGILELASNLESEARARLNHFIVVGRDIETETTPAVWLRDMVSEYGHGGI